ncbi:TNF receptor-associated factor 6-B-like [Amblyomma americanum]
MPDRGMAGRHLLRGHVGGVNWRPTRFAEVVPPWNVCGLCLVIPKRTVQLPCSHILCECCLGASRLEGVTMCPLDREPFEEDECHRIPIPARKANNLKAHCWNEEHGCEFVGTMEAVLRHYEEECTFQTIECRRCAERESSTKTSQCITWVVASLTLRLRAQSSRPRKAVCSRCTTSAQH